MKKYARKCSHCGKLFNEGFCIAGGIDYYCSEECLNAEISQEEQEELDIGGDWSDSYWTEWECEEDYQYYEDGTEIEPFSRIITYEDKEGKTSDLWIDSEISEINSELLDTALKWAEGRKIVKIKRN